MNKRFLIAIISTLLVVSFTLNMYFANQYLLDPDGTLQKKATNIKNQLTNLEEQITFLQNNFNQLKDPKIITNLGISDVRTEPYRLFISGQVGNFGFNTAHNVSLHITLNQDNIIIKRTKIDLGSLDGGASKYISKNIRYIGKPLTNWTITPIYEK